MYVVYKNIYDSDGDYDDYEAVFYNEDIDKCTEFICYMDGTMWVEELNLEKDNYLNRFLWSYNLSGDLENIFCTSNQCYKQYIQKVKYCYSGDRNQIALNDTDFIDEMGFKPVVYIEERNHFKEIIQEPKYLLSKIKMELYYCFDSKGKLIIDNVDKYVSKLK